MNFIGFFKKIQRNSLYAKWILLFTVLIIISEVIAFGLAFRSMVPDAREKISGNMHRKAKVLQEIYYNGSEITEKTLEFLSDMEYEISIIDLNSVSDEEFISEGNITLNMIQKANSGEIVTGLYKEKSVQLPFIIVNLGEKFALIKPIVEQNGVSFIAKGIKKAFFSGSLIASSFIVIALTLFLKPIRKIIKATKEIAGGNYNIKIKSKSNDELGILVDNFNSMAEGLQKMEYVAKNFVSSISHEFKTPITSIEGFAKLLKNKDLSKEQYEEYADIIIKETKRLTKLSSDLLSISLLDSNEYEVDKNLFYLDEQIRNVIVLLQKQWEEKDIQFDIDMDYIEIYEKKELLSQVWINLIQNAIKFSPYGGSIFIKLYKDESKIFFSIKDNGPGIAKENLDRIFDSFFKVDKSRTKEGNGLGLAIVKKILDISNGTIICESEERMGTEFIVCLDNKNTL